MSELEFNDTGECESCRNIRVLSKTGICRECWAKFENLREHRSERDSYLRHLNKIENGVIQATRHRLRADSVQTTRERKLTLNRMLKERDAAKQAQLISRKRLQAIFQATPQDLTDHRSEGILEKELVIVNDELMRWLAKNPESMRELSPRKFEEVVAEILRDIGYTVCLTPATRDGGRDVIASGKIILGEILVIVECKRWLPPNKVGIAVVERFLHVLREKTKANLGIVAATTSFTVDAKKSAREFDYLLKLADFDQLKEMAKSYGTWHQKRNSEIWIPNYAAI